MGNVVKGGENWISDYFLSQGKEPTQKTKGKDTVIQGHESRIKKITFVRTVCSLQCKTARHAFDL